ncbi:MAG: hypothetical protein V8S74_09805 [Lachnospirales bacterium]
MRFKKLFSTVAVSVAAMLALGSVSVLAALPATDPTVALEIGSTYNVTTSGIFAKNSAGKEAKSSDERFVATCAIDSKGFNLKNDGNGVKFLTPASECKVTFTETNSKASKVSWTADGNENSADVPAGGGTVTLPANTVCTMVGATSSSAKIPTVEVKSAVAPTAYYSLSGTVKVNGVAKSGVTVKLRGSDYVTSSTVTTDETGAYKFENIGNIETVDVVIEDGTDYFGATINDISVTSDITGQDFDLTEKVSAKSISTSAFLSANNIDLGSETSKNFTNESVLADYFTVVTDSNPLTVDTANTKFGNTTFTQRIKTNGAGSTSKRAIKFTTTGAGYVQVVAITGSNTDTARKCVLSDGTNELASVACAVKTVDETATAVPTALNYYLSGAGTYYIYSSANIGILSVNVVVGANLTQSSDASKPAAYVNGTDAYILSAVPKASAETSSVLSIDTVGEDNIDTTGTVFESVVIDNFAFDASAVCSAAADGDYIYGVHLENADSEAATNITTKINNSYK